MLQLRYSFTCCSPTLLISSINTNNTIFPYLSFVLHHVTAALMTRIPYHSFAFMLYYRQKSKHLQVLKYNFVIPAVLYIKNKISVCVVCKFCCECLVANKLPNIPVLSWLSELLYSQYEMPDQIQ